MLLVSILMSLMFSPIGAGVPRGRGKTVGRVTNVGWMVASEWMRWYPGGSRAEPSCFGGPARSSGGVGEAVSLSSSARALGTMERTEDAVLAVGKETGMISSSLLERLPVMTDPLVELVARIGTTRVLMMPLALMKMHCWTTAGLRRESRNVVFEMVAAAKRSMIDCSLNLSGRKASLNGVIWERRTAAMTASVAGLVVTMVDSTGCEKGMRKVLTKIR